MQLRQLFLAILVTLFAGATHAAESADGVHAAVRSIETRLGARVGMFVVDSGSGQRWEHRADELFPLNSTFKAIACAALLSRVESGTADLASRVIFGEEDLVDYSPVTEQHTGEPGMSLGELCAATMGVSDNTAANLVLHAIGGPEGLTRFVRSTGDEITRLDRLETAMNEAVPGDPRDTTTPRAIVGTLRSLVLGDTLSPNSRQQLVDWLISNSVSADLFRAAVPDDWTVGDRTGAGGYGSRSIIAVLWPPGRAPVIAAVYITETEASFADRNAAIAEIGRALVQMFRG